MSGKKQKRIQKRTIFFIGEGAEEYVFFEHLHNEYFKRIFPWHITRVKGQGGSPLAVLQKGIREISLGDYDDKYILVDSDVELGVEFNRLLAKHGFRLLQSDKCFSCELARIAALDFVHANQQCKAAVRLHLGNQPPTDVRRIASKYTTALLVERRVSVSLLDKLIRLIETGSLD